MSAGGNMIVAENGSLFIIGKHSFAKGSGFITPGMIKTSRIGAKGYVNFGKNSSWTGATEGRFVNGYVRVTHDQPFVFPIGDANSYRPVASSGAANMTAAYFSKSVTKAYVNKEKSLGRISDKEYWDINGDTPVSLSFDWGVESNIANMTNSQLSQLTLVGWRDNQWEIIPSKVTSSNTNTLKNNSATELDLSKGVISTTNVVVPSDYKYFTLGTLQANKDNNEVLVLGPQMVSVYPNPVVEALHVNIAELGAGKGEIKIYDMNGKEMSRRSLGQESATIQRFDASNYVNGLYKVFIKVDNKQVTQQFMVGKTH